MILIVDDDSAVRSSLSFMLKRAKYEVKTAAGPKEAMDIVRSEEPSLILMDMNFTLSTTGEEGLTLLKQVKIFRPHVPVILNLKMLVQLVNRHIRHPMMHLSASICVRRPRMIM